VVEGEFMKLRGLVPPFNADRQLKTHLSSAFLIDTNDFLWRIDRVIEGNDQTNRSYVAKTLVDMIMCAECAFKSIIISLSQKDESPEDAFKACRKYGHNLEHLFNEAKKRAVRRIRFLDHKDLAMLKEVNKLGVESRYSNPLRFTLLNSEPMQRLFGEDIVSRIVNPEWMGKFRRLLARLFKIARAAYDKYRSKDNAIIGTNLDKRDTSVVSHK
jgi:hypothetical protein